MDINPAVSILAASIYLVFNAFPIITLWAKPQNMSPNSLTWFLIPAVSMIALACGSLWWLGFLAITRRKDKREGTVLNVVKIPHYNEDPQNSGRYVQTHETTYIYRQARADNVEEGRVRNGATGNRNSDFDDLDNF